MSYGRALERGHRGKRQASDKELTYHLFAVLVLYRQAFGFGHWEGTLMGGFNRPIPGVEYCCGKLSSGFRRAPVGEDRDRRRFIEWLESLPASFTTGGNATVEQSARRVFGVC